MHNEIRKFIILATCNSFGHFLHCCNYWLRLPDLQSNKNFSLSKFRKAATKNTRKAQHSGSLSVMRGSDSDNYYRALVRWEIP
jgi:hypothetical protein